MALRELVLESLQNEKLELEAFNSEPKRKEIVESYAESLVALVTTSDLRAFSDFVRVIIEHAYYVGYQRGKSESPDAKKLEDLLGDIDLGKLDK